MTNHWIEDWLGAPRFQKYLDTCQGDRSLALELYEWNVSLGQALMRDIAHFEIALRNAYNNAVSRNWSGRDHWLLDAESPAVMPIWRIKRDKSGLKRGSDVNFFNRRSVDSAIRKCGGVNATPGHVIAELSFGFWSSLTSAANEKSIWVPYLHHAYPQGTDRGPVDKSISAINKVRNRIAHHEPIFDRQRTPELDPGVVSTSILTTLGLLNQDAAAHVGSTSRVAEVLGQRP